MAWAVRGRVRHRAGIRLLHALPAIWSRLGRAVVRELGGIFLDDSQAQRPPIQQVKGNARLRNPTWPCHRFGRAPPLRMSRRSSCPFFWLRSLVPS